jgi:hypothetical protein
MQQARWSAENGLQRMQRVLGAGFETNVDTPRAYLYAGFANRLLGENVCTGIIDGGPPQSDSVYFERADSLFTRAYTIATALKNTSVANAALGGRASVRAWLGNWSGAVGDAALVPTSFVFNAIFGTGTARENNDLANQTITRKETTVFGTVYATIFKDPRTPWDTVKTTSGAVQTGQDGKTKFFRQTKYTSLGSPVPLVKGTEMLLLRAEAALRHRRNDDAHQSGTRSLYGTHSCRSPGNDGRSVDTAPGRAWIGDLARRKKAVGSPPMVRCGHEHLPHEPKQVPPGQH